MKTLIVEDDDIARFVMCEMLKSVTKCDMAENGALALQAFVEALDHGEPYDLICLDIMMPVMDGHEALKAIREEEAKRGILGLDGVKVIMTTALSDPQNIMQSFREQCEAYITKPIEMERLYEEIRNLGLSLPDDSTS